MIPVVGTTIPITFRTKTFYTSVGERIFNNCNTILTRDKEGLFEYEIDGLIFTPSDKAVGSDNIGETVPPKKTTWEHSFKWKPPHFNTIDFLATTKKTSTGEDVIGNIFEDGENVYQTTQITQYKTLILRVGFDERKHGYINPCSDVYTDNIPKFSNKDDTEGYKPVPFYPSDPTPNYPAYICNVLLQKKGMGNYMMTEDGKQVIEDGMVVECKYVQDERKFWQWKPIRVRDKKTAEYRSGGKQFGNAYHVAQSIWKSIHNPVTEMMIRSGKDIPSELVDDDVYYNRKGKTITRSLRDFHNLYVKKKLIMSTSRRGGTLIDQSVGKAGDFSKWIAAKLSFVFGIDYSRDNIENRIDGACARFLNYRKRFSSMPYALFVQGNSSLNIRSGEAMNTEKAREITRAIFGQGAQDEERLGKGVLRQFGKGKDGFDVVSNQFSIHYFFENMTTLSQFLRNVSECCKVGGYFIGTSYDGRNIFRLLEDKAMGDSVSIIRNGVKMWEIKKQYSIDRFENNENSVGHKIEVFQESINQYIPEFLVNFDYLIQLMESFGFALPTREEANKMGLPNAMGNFNELFDEMKENLRRRKIKAGDVGSAMDLNADEKKVSFLNKYFVFKKVRDINARQMAMMISGESVQQELDDVQDSIRLEKALRESTDIDVEGVSEAKNAPQENPKNKKATTRKLRKKLKIKKSETKTEEVKTKSKAKLKLKIKKKLKVKE